MTGQSAGAGRIAYLVAVAAVFVWGILGIADMPAQTWTGYITTPQNVINQIQPGSPAEAAGMRVGDRLVSIGGIPVEDMRALNRAPRPMPGETHEIGIERDGQPQTFQLTYASPSGTELAITWIAVIAGLLFLFMPFPVSSRSEAGRWLGWAGVGLALAFLTGPYLPSPIARNLAGAVSLTAIVLGFAALVRFALAFPHETQPAAKSSTKLLVWGPASVIALMFIYLFLGEPAATTGLNMLVNVLVGLFILAYFGAALLILVRRYMAASPEHRVTNGLSLALWGAVIGLVPPLLATIVSLIAPMVVLPGQNYYFITLGLIPIAFSLAVKKATEVRAAEPAHATAPA